MRENVCFTGVNRTVNARLIQAKHTDKIWLTHEERIVFRYSPPFSSDLTSRLLVFSGVFKRQNKEFTEVFRHSA